MHIEEGTQKTRVKFYSSLENFLSRIDPDFHVLLIRKLRQHRLLPAQILKCSCFRIESPVLVTQRR